MSRSLDLHVALLGILKEWRGLHSLRYDAPPDRIGECLADCEAKLVVMIAVTHGKLDRALPAPAETCLAFSPASRTSRRWTCGRTA